MKKLLMSFLCVAFMLGCKDNNDPQVDPQVEPATIFTLTLPIAYPGTNAWIILRDDATGELIDAKQFGTNSTVSFTSTKTFPTNKLSVALFRPTNWVNESKYYSVDVYRGIDVGSKWSYKDSTYPILAGGNSKGVYNVHLTDVPNNYFAVVSNEFGHSAGAAQTTNTWTGYADVMDNSNNKALVAMGRFPGGPKYIWLDVTAGEDTTISYRDLKINPFDNGILLVFPSTKDIVTNVVAYDLTLVPEFGYKVHWIPAGLPEAIDQLMVGYLDEFKRYSTDIRIDGFKYQADGPAPTTIQYIAPDGYNTNSDYIYSKTSYEWTANNSGFYATYYAPKGSTTQYEPLTPEIISKYSLDLSKLEYQNTDFMVKGRSYENFLNSLFTPAYYNNRQDYEETTVEVK